MPLLSCSSSNKRKHTLLHEALIPGGCQPCSWGPLQRFSGQAPPPTPPDSQASMGGNLPHPCPIHPSSRTPAPLREGLQLTAHLLPHRALRPWANSPPPRARTWLFACPFRSTPLPSPVAGGYRLEVHCPSLKTEVLMIRGLLNPPIYYNISDDLMNKL